MTEAYLVVCGLLLLASLPVRALPITPTVADDDEAWAADTPWDARAVAYLRRGTYGLVLTVLAELHARGGVDARVSGRIRQLDPPADGRYDDPLATAVYLASGWCPEPKLIALLPSVRRAARAMRPDLVARGLLPSLRRRLLSLALLAYAVGLALATAYERPNGSTVAGALVVAVLAAVCTLGPRRTVAGHRFLLAERDLLDDATEDHTYAVGIRRLAPLLASMVAVQGRAALDVLCDGYVEVGALAPKHFDLRPRPDLVEQPTAPPWERITPSWEWVSANLQPPPSRPRLAASYEPAAEGPALVVRPAFVAARHGIAVAPRQRVAA